MSEENVEAVLRSYEVYNEHGVEATAASGFWDKNIAWHDPADFPDAEVHHGIEAAKAALQAYVDLAGHMQVHVEECIDGGDEIFTRWHVHGRGAGSGAPVEGSMYHVSTVKDGKLVRLRSTSTERRPWKPPGCRSSCFGRKAAPLIPTSCGGLPGRRETPGYPRSGTATRRRSDPSRDWRCDPDETRARGSMTTASSPEVGRSSGRRAGN